jgi:hypothetical protein
MTTPDTAPPAEPPRVADAKLADLGRRGTCSPLFDDPVLLLTACHRLRHVEAKLTAVEAERDRLIAERDKLLTQLPDGMEHCTILYKKCGKGHGWLTATNWVEFGCPTCERCDVSMDTAAMHGLPQQLPSAYRDSWAAAHTATRAALARRAGGEKGADHEM